MTDDDDDTGGPADAQGYRRWLIALLTAALVVRIAWAATRPTDLRALRALPDQLEYLELGGNLKDGRGLVFYDARFGQDVRAYRTPGYPFLVALLGADLRAVRVVQALIDTSTVLAAYLLARHWLSPGPSLFAAAIVAANPFLIYFTGLILSETLFIAMLAWGMAILPRRWLAGACILAVSVLVRPSAIALPAVIGGVSAWTNRPRGKAYHLSAAVALRAVVGAAITGLVLLPWAMRNHATVGVRIWTTTNGGITAYDGLNPTATGASDQSFVTQMPELLAMGEVERSRYLAGRAWSWAREHPLGVTRLALVKIARTWSPVPLSAEYGGRWLYAAVGLLYSVPLDVLVIVGLITRRTLPVPAKLLLMLPAVYFTAVHALSVGSLRYRVPAEVPMAIVAASAMVRPRPGRQPWSAAGRSDL